MWRDDDPVTTVMDQVPSEPDPTGGQVDLRGAPRARSQLGYDRRFDGDITGSGEYDLAGSDYGRYASRLRIVDR